MSAMSCNSFEKSNSGQQIGVNNGNITFVHDRPETTQQNVDNEVLRSLAFPHMLDRRDNIELCHTNTCQWILELEEYNSWRSQPGGLLWIKGKPGAGKSTLMAFLYNELKKKTETGSGSGSEIRLEFFFTARGTELQRTPVGMLRSLLNQIFDHDATIRPQVNEVYMQRCRQFGFGEQQWEWPRGLLEDLLAETIIASASRRPLTLFVDALDEAGGESAHQLAEYFHRVNARAQKDTVPVKICISCRHFPVINSRATEIIVENHNREDITTYIKDYLLTDPTMESEESDSDPEAWQGLIDDLIQQANGVFQWAHIIMPIIQRKVQEGNSPRDIRDWLPKVPAGLADVYKYILSHIIDHDNRQQSFLFFQWIYLAERPLTVTEMRYAMAAKDANIRLGRNQWSNIKSFAGTDNRMKLRIKALSRGLAEITSKKDSRGPANIATEEDSEETVQVVHQSVNDFLREEGLIFLRNMIGDSGPSVDNKEEIISQCQATIYLSCLIYLATEQMSSKISLDRGGFKEEELSKAFSLLRYATINIFVHTEKAGRSRVGVIADEVSLLQRLTSYWVRVYQELKRYNLQQDGSPMTCQASGTTLLQIAAAANMIDIIDGLAPNGFTINERNEEGETALHFAAARGHITAAERLQARGADCEARSKKARTPLVEAARYGRVTFVEWLLYVGANINKSTGSSGTALQEAALNYQEGILRLLIGAGAEVNA